MVNVERLLQYNIACLVLLGATLLGLGNSNASLPIMAGTAAVLSLYLTDHLHWFYFNRLVANVAAILAAVYSLNDFFRSNSESQLLAIASLLIYLQMVLLFQRKNTRIYWQLLVLSLLQVVVAAALYVRVESGMLFLAYMLLAVSAMTLMAINRQTVRIRKLADETNEELKRRQAATATGSNSDLLRGRPLLLNESIHTNPKTVKRILFKSIACSAATLIFAGIFFYTIPRSEETYQGPDDLLLNKTGFATGIRFNNKGVISMSEDMVFRATFTDLITHETIELTQDPYFRGAVLNTYRKTEGVNTWTHNPLWARNSSPIAQVELPAPGTSRIRQMIAMEPTNQNILFSAAPFFRNINTEALPQYDRSSDTLFRADGADDEPFYSYSFEMEIGAMRGRAQADTRPYRNRATTTYDVPMGDLEKNFLLQNDAKDDQPTLKALAEDLVKDIPEDDVRRRAQTLAAHLQVSGNYTYTVDFTEVEFNRDIDSVEDFIKNHRQGHCEYFASALCLMLRHIGIPSRIVLGYHGGDFNSLGTYYVVEQKYAHAWVEAYMPPDDEKQQITDEMIANGEASPGGAWLRLDPTPANPFLDDEDLLTRAGDAFDFAQMIWDDFVFNLNAKRQGSTFYERLIGNNAMIERVFTTATWDIMLGDLTEQFGLDRSNRRVVGQILFVLLMLIGALSYWLISRKRRRQATAKQGNQLRKLLGTFATLISPKLGQWIIGDEGHPLAGPPVDFYERFSATLSKYGFVRKDSQTQAEFVEYVRDELRPRMNDPTWDKMFQEIVEQFYAVRFGQRELSVEKASRLSDAVGQLDAWLAENKEAAVSSAT